MRQLKLEGRRKHEVSLEFPVAILGMGQFGSKILVRDVYKDLYNIVVWNQYSDPASTTTPNTKSYIIIDTPGKFTINPLSFSLLILHRYRKVVLRILFYISLRPGFSQC